MSDQSDNRISRAPSFAEWITKRNLLGGKRFAAGLTTMLFCMALLAGCVDSKKPTGQATFSGQPTYEVVAVGYPLQFLAQRIAGEKITVRFPVPKDANPRTWQPSADAIEQMQAADLVIANGTGAVYAKWLKTVSLRDSRVCSAATRGLSLADFITVEDVTIVHSHGPEGEHSHPTMVARTWLNPAIAKKQAAYIQEQLAKTYPELESAFKENLLHLNEELDELTKLASELASDLKTNDVNVITSTPELKFFTQAVSVTDQHLVWSDIPNAEVARKDLEKAIAKLPSPPKLILLGGVGSNAELENLLREKDLSPIVIDLLDHRPDQGDYISALRENLVTLKSAVEAE